MMQKSHEGSHPQAANDREAFVAPSEIQLIGPPRGDTLPQHGITQYLQAQVGEELEVSGTMLVTGEDGLVAVVFVDAVDRTFMAAPELEGLHGGALPTARAVTFQE
jgi:hypothetical protein